MKGLAFRLCFLTWDPDPQSQGFERRQVNVSPAQSGAPPRPFLPGDEQSSQSALLLQTHSTRVTSGPGGKALRIIHICALSLTFQKKKSRSNSIPSILNFDISLHSKQLILVL